MLTDPEIEHIAQLARIQLSPKLYARMRRDLSSVLDYIALLDEVDTSGVDPMYQVTGLQNRTRPDIADRPLVELERVDELLIAVSPHRDERYIKVKSVKAK